jgi:DNA-binding CsgD family transcriptional regulator
MEKRFLERCLSEGMSLDQIAEATGKHPSTVSYHLKKHGLVANGHAKHAPKGKIVDTDLRRLVESGISMRRIAAEFGVSYTAVRHRCVALGIDTSAAARRRRFVEAHRLGVDRIKAVCDRHGETEYVADANGKRFRCMKCRSEAVIRWRRRLKLRLVEEAGGECALCGYDAHPSALQFHHVDPATKSFGLAVGGLTRSLEKIRAEAAKCVLLCSNCHAEVERGHREVPPHLVPVTLGDRPE